MDTTIRLKYTLPSHPTLTTPASLTDLLASFGVTDTEFIVLSLKPPKKSPNKPAKYATALVPFKQIGDALAAVEASGVAQRGMEGIEITWANGGKEPDILGWLRKMGKLGVSRPAGQVEKNSDGPPASTSFSSFPDSFVRPLLFTLHILRHF